MKSEMHECKHPCRSIDICFSSHPSVVAYLSEVLQERDKSILIIDEHADKLKISENCYMKIHINVATPGDALAKNHFLTKERKKIISRKESIILRF